MASGYGINISDWLLAGVVVGAGYLAYKSVIKPISDVTGSVASTVGVVTHETEDIINEAGKLTTDLIKTPEEYWNYWFTMGEDAGATFKGWFT